MCVYKIILFVALGTILNFECLNTTQRIAGGWDAKTGEYPYQASIRYMYVDAKYGPGKGHFCGATIVSPSAVITAAHCVHDKNREINKNLLLVAAGSLNLSDTDNTEVRTVKDIVIHKDFESDGWLNDLAILFLTFPLDLWNASTINLRQKSVAKGTNCTASGWGANATVIESEDDEEKETFTSQWLQAVDLQIWDQNQCIRNYTGKIHKGMICAGHASEVKDTCQGDSGGPLVCEGLLTGVVSFGKQCGQLGVPGVYADVANYWKWIDATLKDGGNNTPSSHIVYKYLITALVIVCICLII